MIRDYWRETAGAIAVAVVMILILAACGTSAKHSAEKAHAKASISAYADTPAGKQAEAKVRAALPQTTLGQLELLRPVAGKAAREHVYGVLEVPASTTAHPNGTNRKALDQAILSAALNAKPTTPSALSSFVLGTVVTLVVNYGG